MKKIYSASGDKGKAKTSKKKKTKQRLNKESTVKNIQLDNQAKQTFIYSKQKITITSVHDLLDFSVCQFP